MSALPSPEKRMSETEYLLFERSSENKHEYVNGEIYAMSGASEHHNIIVSNLIAGIHPQLRKPPCRIYPSDMRVLTPFSRTYSYPDVTIICGKPVLIDSYEDVLLNPTVIFEVLSPSTERYDRGRKFLHYREIESLQEYVLVAQDAPRIERFIRDSEGTWRFSDVSGLDATLELPSIGCVLALADVYETVTFEADESPTIDDNTQG